jgi:hypothetical protein
MRLQGYGIEADVPPGWDGRLFRWPEGLPTLHAASFPLPNGDGDFGDLAVTRMPKDGVLVVLTEYDHALAGRGLFAPVGPPGRIRGTELSPDTLMRTFRGQAGLQRFFSAGARAFCLYVVIGSHRDAWRLAGEVNRFLPTVHIGP